MTVAIYSIHLLLRSNSYSPTSDNSNYPFRQKYCQQNAAEWPVSESLYYITALLLLMEQVDVGDDVSGVQGANLTISFTLLDNLV